LEVNHSRWVPARLLPDTSSDASGTATYAYDLLDRVTSRASIGGSTVSYTYNTLNEKTNVAEGSLNVYYKYFANGWLKNVRKDVNDDQTGHKIADYAYDYAGDRAKSTFGKSTWNEFIYDSDPRARLWAIKYACDCLDTNGIKVQGGLVTPRDNVGNPTYWEDAGSPSTWSNPNDPSTWTHIGTAYQRQYTYDPLNRLWTENYAGASQTDGYDWVGNRTSRGTASFSYNAVDELTAYTGVHQYDYYADGSLHHTKTDPGGTTQDTYTYGYDHLVTFIAHAGAGTSSMTWDSEGNRVIFTSSTGGDV